MSGAGLRVCGSALCLAEKVCDFKAGGRGNAWFCSEKEEDDY